MGDTSLPNQVKDDIVISGISGRFPECNNVEEFKQKLLEGIDLVTEDDRRWPVGFCGLPTRSGKLNCIKEFDAVFFGVSSKQAHKADPQQRLLLETTFEAILDAGVNPTEIRGSNVGVFIGSWDTDSNCYWRNEIDNIDPSSLMNMFQTLLANKISYAFNFNGPSYTVDTGCSSSLVAFENAITAIQSGNCDSAIVAGSNTCLIPAISLQLNKIGVLSPCGKCRAFDSSAKGYVRSEAVVAIYIQKASKARRVYATILGAKVNSDGYKEQGVTFPSMRMQYKLLKSLYNEIGVNLTDVKYIETHGTGTKAGDPEEANSIAKLFCKNRKEPLLIGSLKSNMGHSEGAAGLCSIVKVIIAMEHGLIPGNLHYQNPHSEIPALLDGRLKVVTKNEKWKGGLIGINSFGIGGTNAHVVLQPNLKPKTAWPTTSIPRLAAVSGRTKDAVTHMLNSIEKQSNDPELIALLDKIHLIDIPGHEYRGYSILGKSVNEVTKVASTKRPVWFVYSGMGSQWNKMAKQMMQLDIFKNSIRKSADALSKLGVDLEDLLTNDNEVALENITNAFLCIASVQIALTDVLKSLGIEPDGVVGHSVGEVGCAYADGSLTAQQAILAILFRGQAFMQANLIPGKMVSVGLTWEECQKRCPPDIFPACHNAKDNVTLSGPSASLEKFFKQLQSENIFAKTVKGCTYPFHTKYVAPAGKILSKSLEAIIPHPKKRSSKWISSSIPEANWNSALAQSCSATYLSNNAVSPVLFYEAIQHIPENAIVIEMAPHGLLQALLKRSFGANATHISLMKRDHADNMQFFLSNIGRLFTAGCHPNIGQLYDPVPFPVGRGTPMIAPLIQWDHSEKWDIPSVYEKNNSFGEHKVDINLTKQEYKYLSGHVVDGRILFPGAGYLILAWKTFAKLRNEDFEKMPIVIENVKFHRATIMPKNKIVTFLVNVFKGSGNFEICESGSIVVSGTILVPEEIDQEFKILPQLLTSFKTDGFSLNAKDIYTEQRLRGYDYAGEFRGILESDSLGTKGTLQWNNNWIAFVDTMMQFFAMGRTSRHLYIPEGLQRFVLNPLRHSKITSESGSIPVSAYQNLGIVTSGGIEINGCKFSISQLRQHLKSPPKLETYEFIPLHHTITVNDKTTSQRQALTIASQIVLENLGEVHKLKIVEVPGEICLGPTLKAVMELEPLISVEYTVLNPKESHMIQLESINVEVVRKNIEVLDFEDVHLVVLVDAIQNESALKNAMALLKPNKGFLLLEETTFNANEKNIVTTLGLEIVSIQMITATSKCCILLRKAFENTKVPTVLHITDNNFNWVEPLKEAMQKSETDGGKIYLVAQGQQSNGLVGMVNCLKKEPGGSNIRSYFLQNSTEAFTLSSSFYDACIKRDLVHNILSPTNKWGTFRHLLLEPDQLVTNVQVEHAFIAPETRGNLSSMKWIQSPLAYHMSEKSAELCTVYYAPLNFRDVLLATGKLPSASVERECFLGFEFSGRDSTGRRVMGVLDGNGLATTCVIDSELLVEVPERWSLKEAATIPIVYATCYYAMIIRGQMQPGESILIHAGAGGIGQAAISIALHMKCTVFTTVGSKIKKEFLKKEFPQLKDSYIGNSRDTSFEQLVMTETEGRGVDLVLNSLAGEQLLASVRCLATEGRFLEIGKMDMINDMPLGFSTFLENRMITGIALDDVMRSNTPLLKQINCLINEGIKNGAVRPIPTMVFPDNEVQKAFKLMASGAHIGKVLIQIKEEEKESLPISCRKPVTAVSRTYMNPSKSYIVIGGLGGFGLELTNWLISKGATKIILTSRNGIKTGYQLLCLQRWKQNGANVIVSTTDAVSHNGALHLINEAKALGPVGGIFNLALVLHDALIQNQSEASFLTVVESKVATTHNLDKASREHTSSLEHFVVFSSITSGRGNAGQSNYGLGNSAAERICESRRAIGLPGLAIQWGPIGDVGYFIDTLGDNDTHMAGVVPQKIHSCLKTLEIFLKQPHPVVSSIVLADKTKGESKVAESNIVTTVGNLLCIKDVNAVSQTLRLAELGMDSLVGTEIKQVLEKNYDLLFSTQEIRDLTFQRLNDLYTTSVSGSKTVGVSDTSNWCEIVPKNALVKMYETANTKTIQPAFFIHSLDGTIKSLQSLAKIVGAFVYGLQYTKDCQKKTINELAQYYIEQIRTVQKRGPYLIVGYEFGACVAFEIGLQLEVDGEKVAIVLLDGSHFYVPPSPIPLHEDTSLKQSKAFAYFVSLHQKIDLDLVANSLIGMKTLKEQIAHVSELLSKSAPYLLEDIDEGVTSLWDKLAAAAIYKPSVKFEGDVTLVKFKESVASSEDDYGLNLVCKQKVNVFLLDGSRETITTQPTVNKVANIVKEVINKAYN